MFDLGRIGGAVLGFFGSAAQDTQPGQNLLETLQSSGLSLDALQGLDVQQVMELLQQQGIDISQFAPDQVQQVLGGLGVDVTQLGDLGSLVSGLLDRR